MAAPETGTDLERLEFDYASLFAVAWANRWLILLSSLVCGAIAAVLAFTATPIFTAETAIIQVSNKSLNGGASLANQFGGLASLVGVNLNGMGGAGKEADGLLRSRLLCEEFVKKYNVAAVVYANSPKPPSQWFVVRQFQKGLLSIREDKRTGLTLVTVSWKDPRLAAQWVNDFVALANDMMRVRAMRDAKASIAYLTDQITHTTVVEIQRVMYSLIESETKDLMLASVKPEYAFTVVDPAVPPEVRSSPHRSLMIAMGVAFGGLLGVAYAFARAAIRRHRGGTVAAG